MIDVMRTDRHQRLSCAACGQPRFLLPRDAYPGEPPEKHVAAVVSQEPGPAESTPSGFARQASTRPETTARRGDGSVARGTSRTSPTRPGGGSSTKSRAVGSPPPEVPTGSASEARSEAKPEPPPSEPAVTRTSIQLEPEHATRRRVVTPFRLVGVGIVLAIGVTAWWGIGQARLADDAGRLSDQIRTGLAALESGDFGTAARDLSDACSTLDRLGRTDPQAELIRQRGREARAADGLMAVPLLEMLNEADRVLRQQGADDWLRRFDLEFRDKWIIIQSPLVTDWTDDADPDTDSDSDSDSDSDDSHRFAVEYPFTLGDREVRLVGSLGALVRLSGEGAGESEGDSRPVIFAGQLEACGIDSKTDRWKVVFKEGSVFLWTDLESFRQLGFLPDPLQAEQDVRKLLIRQIRAVGLDASAEPDSKDEADGDGLREVAER